MKAAAPATPAEAEELAKKAVGDYLTACRMTDREQIGNYLLKLASVAGVVMANAEGSSMAAARFMATAQFIANNMPDKPATLVPLQ
ncbi:MAG TPA: hypothetical protein PK861_00370 [Thermomonas sp.]|nr:hypothetical protein [Thermomonas sp.]